MGFTGCMVQVSRVGVSSRMLYPWVEESKNVMCGLAALYASGSAVTGAGKPTPLVAISERFEDVTEPAMKHTPAGYSTPRTGGVPSGGSGVFVSFSKSS